MDIKKAIETVSFLDDTMTASKLMDHVINCDDSECCMCGMIDCPHDEPLHYHHDGCPSCAMID